MKYWRKVHLSLLALASGLVGWAQPASPAASEQRLLRVGAPHDAYPYSYVDEQGKWRGFSTEVLDAVARTMHLTVERSGLASRGLTGRFQDGAFDLVQHIQQSAEREAFAEFTVPLLTLQGAVFVQRDGGIRRPEDLAGKNFAIFNVGSIGERWLKARGIAANLVAVDSPAAALRLVDEGRCAGAFVSKLTALALIERDGLRRTTVLDEAITGFDVRHCFAVHKGDAQLLARLNEGLAILHRTGEFDRIYHKWFGRLEGATFTREQVVNYVAAALALALAVAVWGVYRQRLLRRRIEQLNAELEQRVRERTAELAQRVVEVENLNAELEAFSYSVSHDLRAPLRNITGFLELLERRSGGRLDAEEARYVQTVTREAARLGTLIDDLLTFSRMGRAEMHPQRVPLAELVAEVRHELQSAIGARTVEWKIGSLPVVEGDRALLRLVWANLLGNAVKFTRRRAVAVIEIGAVAPVEPTAGVTLFVRDNGAGFNPKYGEKLFGVFQRLHNQRDFEGTGIGLANVKRIVARHGGRVWAEGKIDSGATFYFNLRTRLS